MGKNLPWGNQKIRSGLGMAMIGTAGNFTNVASLIAAGYTAASCKGAIAYLTVGGTGSVPCIAISDGTTWKQVAIGVACI